MRQAASRPPPAWPATRLAGCLRGLACQFPGLGDRPVGLLDGLARTLLRAFGLLLLLPRAGAASSSALSSAFRRSDSSAGGRARGAPPPARAPPVDLAHVFVHLPDGALGVVGAVLGLLRQGQARASFSRASSAASSACRSSESIESSSRPGTAARTDRPAALVRRRIPAVTAPAVSAAEDAVSDTVSDTLLATEGRRRTRPTRPIPLVSALSTAAMLRWPEAPAHRFRPDPSDGVLVFPCHEYLQPCDPSPCSTLRPGLYPRWPHIPAACAGGIIERQSANHQVT